MKQEVKAEWVRRLRSGEYEQGAEYLRRDDRFCCLGVLCDIAVEGAVVDGLRGADGIYSYDKGRDTEILPPSVQQWAGLTSDNAGVRSPRNYWAANGAYIEAGEMAPLASLNDAGFTFDEIADLIEEQL